MGSNASEDFPDPLTPVTTVMALCGISTLIFFRLWTRAPRTRMDSCSGRISFVVWVSSLVTKGKPRQRVERALSKLQIIRLPSNRSKRPDFDKGARNSRLKGVLEFLAKHNLANAAFYLQANRSGSLSVSVIRVSTVFVFQSVRFHVSDSSGSVHDHAHVFWQSDIRLPHAPFDIGRQIRLAVAGEIDIHLSRADIQIQARERHIAQMQISLPRAHVDLELHWNIFAEMQVPIVPRTADVDGLGILRNSDLANAVGDAVVHAGLVVRTGEGKIRIHEVH